MLLDSNFDKFVISDMEIRVRDLQVQIIRSRATNIINRNNSFIIEMIEIFVMKETIEIFVMIETIEIFVIIEMIIVRALLQGTTNKITNRDHINTLDIKEGRSPLLCNRNNITFNNIRNHINQDREVAQIRGTDQGINSILLLLLIKINHILSRRTKKGRTKVIKKRDRIIVIIKKV